MGPAFKRLEDHENSLFMQINILVWHFFCTSSVFQKLLEGARVSVAASCEFPSIFNMQRISWKYWILLRHSSDCFNIRTIVLCWNQWEIWNQRAMPAYSSQTNLWYRICFSYHKKRRSLVQIQYSQPTAGAVGAIIVKVPVNNFSTFIAELYEKENREVVVPILRAFTSWPLYVSQAVQITEKRQKLCRGEHFLL